MLTKEQFSTWFKHPPHLFHCGQPIGNGAQRICKHNAVYAIIFEGYLLAWKIQPLEIEWRSSDASGSHA